MKLVSVLVLFLVMINDTNARLFQKKGKSTQANKRAKGANKKPIAVPSSANKIDPITMDEIPIAHPNAPEEPPEFIDTERMTNKIRVTLTDVDEMESLTSTEIMFFEDTFMLALMEALSMGDGSDDIHARSVIVLPRSSSPEDSQGNLRGGHERALWGTSTTMFFDIFALLEWSCYFCGNKRSGSEFTDDNVDDDFYFAGMDKTASPTASPTRPPTYEDDTTDDDFYFSGGRTSTYDVTQELGDDHTDDTFYFSSPTAKVDDEWGLSDHFNDDDGFTFFFGKRQLTESYERRFEELLCARLRTGRYRAFHHVGECLVVFTD